LSQSEFILGSLNWLHDGTKVVGKWDMCHPILIYLPMHLVGSTCPRDVGALPTTSERGASANAFWHMINCLNVLKFHMPNVNETIKKKYYL
jgi:hypothetical protein